MIMIFVYALTYEFPIVRLAEHLAAMKGPGSVTPSDAHPAIVWWQFKWFAGSGRVQYGTPLVCW